jgi:ABC-type phosphate transport system substrate-binding protein
MSTENDHGPRNERRSLALRGVVAACVLAIAASFDVAARAESADEDLRVIVNPSNSTTAVTREFLASAFLKKTTRWEHGETIRPVDLPQASVVRRTFTANVLRRSVSGVRNYWQQNIFSGRGVPPPELESQAAVAEYVAKHAGAIGYVSRSFELRQVRALSVR